MAMLLNLKDGTYLLRVSKQSNAQLASTLEFIKMLEKEGYIKRQIPEFNKRQKIIMLTNSGKELVDLTNKIYHLEFKNGNTKRI